MKLARELALGVGWTMAAAGIAAYDWRLALIVAGASIVCGAFLGFVFGDPEKPDDAH